jgi:hypothetical protein
MGDLTLSASHCHRQQACAAAGRGDTRDRIPPFAHLPTHPSYLHAFQISPEHIFVLIVTANVEIQRAAQPSDGMTS